MRYVKVIVEIFCKKGFFVRVVIMKKRYIRGLMLIMLIGAVSGSYSADWSWPSGETMKKYAPWLGSGAALGGALGYYGAGRYMGYDPYLAAAIGLLIGSGVGGYGVRSFYNESVTSSPA